MSGLNPEASVWRPPNANTGGNGGESANAQAHAHAHAQAETAEPHSGAARGRRSHQQNGNVRDGAPGRARGRGGQQNAQPTAQPTAPSSAPPSAQRGREASRGSDHADRGSRGGRGGRGRGRGRGGLVAHAASGSSIAPPRAFGSQLSAALPDRLAAYDGSEIRGGRAQRSTRRRAGGPASRAGRQRPDRSSGGGDSENSSIADGSVDGPKLPHSTAPDLTTRIHEDIDAGNYDCPICLNVVTRASRIWACSMCYHVAHYACVAAWVKQALDEGLALERIRCPACNSESSAAEGAEGDDRNESGFFGRQFCWCGKQKFASSAAPAALPPHSCGRICNRPRPDCHHTCPDVCHAGPCPPCTETGPLVTCFCGKETSVKPCVAGNQVSWSCEQPCGQRLACRTHTCQRTCHPDDCGACTVPLPSICYCGKTRRDLPCKDRGPPQRSTDYGQVAASDSSTSTPSPFEGTFECETVCGRAFDCGMHFCTKPCHPQDATPAHCPTSPDVVTHCLCGKTRLSDMAAAYEARTSCRDAISACGKLCNKTLDCGHACPQTCHAGACAPCAEVIQAPCACGQTASPVVCSNRAARDDVRCEGVCRAWLSCKQHRCNNVCCAGKPKAAARLAETKKRSAAAATLVEFEAEHTCLRPCGRLLKCGRHTCPQVCHRGACYSCVAYVHEALRCPCGHTTVAPPFRCGTTLPACDADCPRPLPCGHPAAPHPCHDSGVKPCPRCQRLVSKPCLCGKLVLGRVACGADNIQCSNVCGRTLKCGLHKCRLPCHLPGQCEDAKLDGAACGQVCARPKAACGHPCTKPCHSGLEDGSCSEEDPCGSAVEVACDCRRQTRKVRCNVCAADPSPAYRRPACDDECLRVQRNALLKEALRISDDYRDEHLVYPTAAMEYFIANRAFAAAQEDKIRAYARGLEEADPAQAPPPPVCVFKPMKRHERQFLHLMAETFGLRSESRDDEPHRYVFLTRARGGGGGGAAASVAVPSISLAESEDIYVRLREKAKAEAAVKEKEESDAAAAAAAAIKEKEKEAIESSASASAKKRPFNAIFVPAARAAGGSLDDPDRARETRATLDTIIEAWWQQEALRVHDHALHQHTLQNGDVVLKVLVPAAAPAAVERLLAFLLSYVEEWLGASAEGEGGAEGSPDQITLCHVDAKYAVLRLGTDSQAGDASSSASDDDEQWNVVASGASRSSATATPAATALPGGKRVVFKLRKAGGATPEAERKRWMAILAQQPTDEQEEEKQDNNDDDAGKGHESEEDGEEVEAKTEAEAEALKVALEKVLVREEEEGEGEEKEKTIEGNGAGELGGLGEAIEQN